MMLDDLLPLRKLLNCFVQQEKKFKKRKNSIKDVVRKNNIIHNSNTMSTYDLGSAFKTPSKSKPAKVIRNTQRQIVVSEKDKLEESLIDEEFGLIDQEEERSLFSAEIVPSSRTPVYSPRKSKRDFEREGHETTVTELTKLITHLSHNQSSRFERIIMSRYTAILILIVTVLFFAPNLRPYCGQGE